jgi:hypothetical protein
MIKTSDTTLSLLAIASASFYLPLTFWASNVWDIGSPTAIILYGAIVAAAAIGLFLVFRKSGVSELFVALSIALSIMILMSWHRLPLGHPLLGVVLIGVAVAILAFLQRSIQRGIAVAVILLFGVAAIAQLTISHVSEAAQIPLLTPTAREPASATGQVEDVLVIVVDGYPSLAWATQRFGHDTEFIETSLAAAGFVTPAVGWSQHPNTSFSVSALMELRPIVDPTSDAPWSNSRNLGSIIGGDSLVASTLRSAGFKHTQLESGWHLGQCSQVDVCIRSSWVNETTWSLLESSIIGGWLETKYGSWFVPASKSVEQHLLDLRPLFDDGNRDFVFAHLTLPHEPFVVDEHCNPHLPDPGTPPFHEPAVRNQLTCTDRIISRIIEMTNERTAVLITSDHGIKSASPLQKSPDSWTTNDIADAFTILLSYKMPAACQPPDRNMNTFVMSAIIECATTFETPANDGELLIGLQNHRWVDASTQREIELRLGMNEGDG